MLIERRKFKRHSLQFQLEIRGHDPNGTPFHEKAQLMNISGSGALFNSLQVDHYFEGQVLETTILLPATPAIQGRMRTRATVVRLIRERNNGAIISLNFLDPFRLFRDDGQMNRLDSRDDATGRE